MTNPPYTRFDNSSHLWGFVLSMTTQFFRRWRSECSRAHPSSAFLLGYRALARELYTKRAAVALSDLRRNMDKGKMPAEQVLIQETIQLFEIGLEAGLRSLNHCKALYDEILQTRKFAPVRAYVIEFEYPPPVMCSGAIWLEQDFVGADLQDVADLSSTLDLICFTSFHGGERGVVAFSWLAMHDRTCRAFVESLNAIPDKYLTAALLRLASSHTVRMFTCNLVGGKRCPELNGADCLDEWRHRETRRWSDPRHILRMMVWLTPLGQ